MYKCKPNNKYIFGMLQDYMSTLANDSLVKVLEPASNLISLPASSLTSRPKT